MKMLWDTWFEWQTYTDGEAGVDSNSTQETGWFVNDSDRVCHALFGAAKSGFNITLRHQISVT